MEVVLSNSAGSFTIKPEVKHWMLLNGGEDLFVKYPLEISHFDKNVVLKAAIESDVTHLDIDIEHGGMIDDRWGKFNTHLVDTKEECFCEIPFKIKNGEEKRSHKTLIKAVRKFELDEFRIEEVNSSDYKISKDSCGEFFKE